MYEKSVTNKEEKQDKLREQALTWLTFTEQEAKRVKILEQRRKDLEKVFNKKVNLFLFIKIKNNWMNNIKELNHLG